MEEKESCKAVLEQGEKMGQRCWRSSLENGFCGKHQTQAVLEDGKKKGKKKCKKYRCVNLIDESLKDKYCPTCIEKKNEKRKEQNICIAKIEQGENKGKQCDKLASNGEYCGKHYEANRLREEAKAQAIRICDDGRRACKNTTIDGKLKCEECLSKTREKENNTYKERKAVGSECVTCGTDISGATIGLRSENIHQCNSCYEKSRQIEQKRDRSERNYKEDYKANILSYYNQYIRNASLRNIHFELSLDYFAEIVSSQCVYCGHYNENEVNGIDRVDSYSGYVLENVVSCCSICNIMKNDLAQPEFLKHIEKIYNHIQLNTFKNEINIENTATKKSFIRPSEIVKLYTTNKLTAFIDLCKEENRSPLFIEKIVEAQQKKLKEKEFRAILKVALMAEYTSEKKTKEHARQRIPKKALFGYLDNKKVDLFIKIYQDVHGSYNGFEEDTRDLSSKWSLYSTDEKNKMLNKLLIKYQNIRNQHK
jgi:hypothetical protein